MTPLLVLGVAVGGGLGAAGRLAVDTAVRARFPSPYGLGTVLINVAGSLLLGLLTGLATRGVLPDAWRAVLGTGVCGGYTTFSTASLDTARLLAEGRRGAGVLHGLGTLVVSVLAALVGLWVTL